MILQLRPYRPGDEGAFEPRAEMAEEARINAWNWAKGPPGPTWTMLGVKGLGDEVLGMGGGIPGEGGAWLAWACLSDLPARRWPEAVRLAGMVVDHLLKRPDVRWLWAQARADRRGARLLLERLGFRFHHLERPEAYAVDVVCMLIDGAGSSALRDLPTRPAPRGEG